MALAEQGLCVQGVSVTHILCWPGEQGEALPFLKAEGVWGESTAQQAGLVPAGGDSTWITTGTGAAPTHKLVGCCCFCCFSPGGNNWCARVSLPG